MSHGRLDLARKRIHTDACIGGVGSWFPCLTCPRPATVEAALEHLDAHPGDAAGARLIFHDAVCCCHGDCSSRVDHARNTQSTRVAALRRFRKHEENLT